MRMIINADDFGMSENANNAIERCFADGLLTQTTLMVNDRNCCEAAIEIARRNGFYEHVGLHVNLTDGVPLTDPIKRSRIFCEDGHFSNRLWKNTRYKFYLPKFEREVARIEIAAQMRRFIDFGLPMRHCDAHRYVNVYLPLRSIYLQCARDLGFKSTRGYMNTCAGESGEVGFVRRLYIDAVERSIDKAGLYRADYLCFARDLPRLIPMLKTGDAVVEVHCHPNYRDDKGDLTINGELCDWLMSYASSFAFIKKYSADVETVAFNEINA